MTDAQRLSSLHRSIPTPNRTLATAKHSILRGRMPRYALVLQSTSKVSDKFPHSDILSRLDRHTEGEDVSCIVSQDLTTTGNCYHTLHTWIDK